NRECYGLLRDLRSYQNSAKMISARASYGSSVRHAVIVVGVPHNPTLFPYTTLFRSAASPSTRCTPCRGRSRETRSGFRLLPRQGDRKSTRLNSSHSQTSYAAFCSTKKLVITVWRARSPSGRVCVSRTRGAFGWGVPP